MGGRHPGAHLLLAEVASDAEAITQTQLLCLAAGEVVDEGAALDGSTGVDHDGVVGHEGHGLDRVAMALATVDEAEQRHQLAVAKAESGPCLLGRHGQLARLHEVRDDAQLLYGYESTQALDLDLGVDHDAVGGTFSAELNHASFIGLAKVLERPLELAERDCRLVALIKPQFEVAREEVGKGGVVRDAGLHQWVCDEVSQWLQELGWDIEGIVESPITGPQGNVEFLVSAKRG